MQGKRSQGKRGRDELPPIPWTLQEGDSVVSFELHRTDIAE